MDEGVKDARTKRKVKNFLLDYVATKRKTKNFLLDYVAYLIDIHCSNKTFPRYSTATGNQAGVPGGGGREKNLLRRKS